MKKIDRKEQLVKILGNDEVIKPLIDEVIFLEDRLDELKKYTFLKVHPDKPELQKATPAAKQYKEFLQQYLNCIKVLERMAGDDSDDEESPLRKWVNNRLRHEEGG